MAAAGGRWGLALILAWCSLVAVALGLFVGVVRQRGPCLPAEPRRAKQLPRLVAASTVRGGP